MKLKELDSAEVESKTSVAWRRVRRALSGLGELRDGFLVAAAVLYMLGYAVRSYYAWEHNLGLLPALDAQYFIAGMVPAGALWVLYILAKGLHLLQRKIPDWLGPNVGGLRLFLRRAVIGACALLVLGLFVVGMLPERISGELLPPISALLMVSLFFLPPMRSPENRDNGGVSVRTLAQFVTIVFSMFTLLRLYRTIARAYVWIIVLSLPLVGLGYFVVKVYPEIPEAIGGVRPRTAYLDITKAELSPSVQKAILTGDSLKRDLSVARTKEVKVFHLGDEFVLLAPLEGEDEAVYQIKADLVKAVVWK